MASVKQRGKKQRWYAMYRDENGKQHNEPLDAQNRRQAQDEANLREDIANRRKDERTTRRAIEQLFEKFYSDTPSIREYLEQWVKNQRASVKDRSFENCTNAVAHFLDFLDDSIKGFNSNEKITLLTRQHVQDFVSHFAGLRASGTVNNYIGFIQQALNDAKRDKVISDNPAEFINKVKKDPNDDSPSRRPFTIPEMQTILKNAPDQEWYSMILFGAYIGQRISDIANLRWGNIDLEKGMIHLITIKNDTHVDVYIAPPLLEYISTLKIGRPDQPLHPNAYPNARNTRVLSAEFVSLLKRIGLRKDDPEKIVKGRKQTSEISFHSLRHSVVSMLKEAGIADAAIEEYVGQSAEIQRQYTHVGEDALRKAAAAFPRL
jgi:integrase